MSQMAQAVTTTEERVIEGARRAIAAGGWQSATLTRIAEEAGVSRMTLHRRGLGRDEIFALLARDYEEAFRAALWPSVTARGSGAERLEATLLAVCAVTEDHLDFLAALDEEADRRFFHEATDEVHSREGFIGPLERLLLDGIGDGSIRGGIESEETATVLVNACDRTYRHLRRAHDWSAERARGAIVDMLLRGVLPGQPSRNGRA
jgi:AcrR family transcriptional regulator